MAGKKFADRRRKFINHPAHNPELRWYLKRLNAKVSWGTTTTSTTTTTTTTTTSTTTTGA